MANQFGYFLGQILAVLFWGAVLHAPILMFVSKRLRGWKIKYIPAAWVSVKAQSAALVAAYIVGVVGSVAGASENITLAFGFVLAIASWWVVHGESVYESVKAADSTVSRKDATAVTAGTLAGFFAVTIIFSFLVVFILQSIQ